MDSYIPYNIAITLIISTLIYGFFKIYFKNSILNHINILLNGNQTKKPSKKYIGLLTNEIPPIIYGGVATWIIQFMEMFNDDENYTIIPIFLAYNDTNTKDIENKYPNIRIIKNQEDLKEHFKDIDICINNLWIALDTIKELKEIYPNLPLISVCHSLIKMEHLTNLGSCYTNTYSEQEITFQYSDYIVLISKAELDYYNKFGYNKYKAKPVVIYNSYKPQFDNKKVFDNYDNNNLGYIGRHVPRKRPELPILSVNNLCLDDVKVYNMGVDYGEYGNTYWEKLEKTFKDQLNIIPFSSNKELKELYYKNIGVNCCTGIYEPFGYTLCEVLDRRIPVIVQNIDGPIEIIDKVKDYVYIYKVDKESLEKDVQNFSKTLKEFYTIDPETRLKNSDLARKALDRFRPEIIKLDWLDVLNNLGCKSTVQVEKGYFEYVYMGIKNLFSWKDS
jgi:hypothetical protein